MQSPSEAAHQSAAIAVTLISLGDRCKQVMGTELGGGELGMSRGHSSQGPGDVEWKRSSFWFVLRGQRVNTHKTRNVPACGAHPRNDGVTVEVLRGGLGSHLKQDYVGLCLTWFLILSEAWKIPAC